MKVTPNTKVPTTIIKGTTITTATTLATASIKTTLEYESEPIIDTAKAERSSATANSSAPASFVLKCLLRTARFMWQVTTIPSKIGDTIGTLYRYAQDSVDTFLCVAGKARRKERDGDQNSTDTKLYLEESVLERKLPEADLKALVDLPAGLDYNEWLASHTLALFEHVNLVYGTISEFCTQSGCADMTGPGNRTYLWFDEKGKKTRVAAPQYIDYVMTFTQKTVSDESIFPTKYANEFPSSFESIARKILRLQFHVIAHLYAAHFREIALLGLHTHLNLTFMHLTALHRRFNLIDEKETDVLRDLEVALRLTDDNSVCGQDSQTDSGSASASASVSVSASNCEQQQQQQQPQQPHNNSSSNSNSNNSNSSAEALHVNSQSSCGTSLIDGDAAATPICTQPEPGAAGKPPGSGGLLGGILGDLTSGEFGDTTRYCTSAVPPHATAAAAAGTDASGHTLPPNGATNGAAGALHLNFSNNNSNNHNLNHLNHHHHHHTHHHHHHHHPHTHLHHLHQHHATAAAAAAVAASPTPQHSGLIQCNAAGAATAAVASASASAAAGGGSGNSNT
ncbi:MOB kinase activator-like 2 isoform X3 [Drosophila hydei]|uniref:MOB kinase activator-like 2 n=1 Tax=Drosophila hydei TaxID=7224 RepID=A0A6J1L3L1_DROHY|nr:MOB kinase activator-like 2 isoform X3 [Drosophila hydei]XP_023161001.2 MOB kinase activator-like 2 isoform X3 [Drosophila hydei]XP_030081591.1 MOB kinase activator-like 2 isoform X3 [Drosophila hydei]